MGDTADDITVPSMHRCAQLHAFQEFPGKCRAFSTRFRKQFRAQNTDVHRHAGIDHAVLHAGRVAFVVREAAPDLLRKRKKIETVFIQGGKCVVDQMTLFAKQKTGHLLPCGIQRGKKCFIHKVLLSMYSFVRL